jgi:hypothetical protein
MTHCGRSRVGKSPPKSLGPRADGADCEEASRTAMPGFSVGSRAEFGYYLHTPSSAPENAYILTWIANTPPILSC